jgi:hypothetical protein
VGAAVPFAVVLLQTIFGRYGDRFEEAWTWLLPSIVPTLSLIVGVLVRQARTPVGNQATTDRFIARLTLFLSIGYLLTVNATLLLSPFAWTYASIKPLALLKLSHLWLAPLQGLVTAAMGALFVDKDKT